MMIRQPALPICILLLGLAALLPASAHAEFMDVDDLEFRKGGFEASTDRGIRWTDDSGAFEARVGGRLHLDGYIFDEDQIPLGDGGFEVRRARLYGTLKLFEDWKIKLDGEISDYQGRRGWRNLWLSYTGFPGTKLRLGNQIAPMSIEETTSSNDVTFLERSLANALVPSYLTGMSATYASQTRQRWTMSGGLFWQQLAQSDLDKREADGASVVLRGSWLPWDNQDENQFVHLAGSFEYRNVGEDFRLRTRPESGGAKRLLSTGILHDVDDAFTFGAELAGVYGPFSLQGEYIGTRASRDGDRTPLAFGGWYTQVSWMVTGESRRYSRKRATFVSMRPKSRWGGVELAARYSALDLTDDDVIGGKERNVTAGINWYLTRYMRMMFNYVWVDAQRRGDLQTERPQIFQLRMQLAI